MNEFSFDCEEVCNYRALRSGNVRSSLKVSKVSEIVQILQTCHGISMFNNCFLKNMNYKIERYTLLLSENKLEIERQKKIILQRMSDLRSVAQCKDESDNWHIFESMNSEYKELQCKTVMYEDMIRRAQFRLKQDMELQRIELIYCLKELECFATTQTHVVDRIVDLLSSFWKDPKSFRMRMLNMMLLGEPGTGKTMLSTIIAKTLSSSGIFIGNRVVECGRADLIAQYEGQTVAKTRNFLISNLDNGVVFIDEAYSLSMWDRGKPESYGLEALTAMVEFMTQFQGLYCIIVAGYETQMVRYFLGTNEGLDRRYPLKFLLGNVSTENLIHIFKKKLVELQGNDGKNAIHEVARYFDNDAWRYLSRVLSESTSGENVLKDEYDESTKKTYYNIKQFEPAFPLMFQIFKNQAGSMTILAEEALTVLFAKIQFKEIFESQKRGCEKIQITTHSRMTMREIICSRINNCMLSNANDTISELSEIEFTMKQGRISHSHIS